MLGDMLPMRWIAWSCRSAALAALLSTTGVDARAQCVLDQSQEVYEGGTSARTLPGYTVWQSFTPSVTGTLCEIDMGFFNDMAGEGQLDVLEGEGTAGAVLGTWTVPVVGESRPGATWNAWTVSVPITAGLRYTFRLTPDAATLPDPYGVCVGGEGTYARGTMGIDDPSGSYPMPFDTNFRTHVGASATLRVYRAPEPEGLLDPSNVVATVPGPPHLDLATPAAPLTCWLVDDGAGSPDLIFVLEDAAGDILISWD